MRDAKDDAYLFREWNWLHLDGLLLCFLNGILVVLDPLR